MWAIIGYFSFIDLGLSKTLTIIISEKLGSNKNEEISILISTTLITVVILGVLGTITVLSVSSWIVIEKLKISENLIHETLISVYIIAFSLPIISLSSSLKGILISYQRFFFINIQRTLLGFIMFVGPLILIPFSISIVPIIILLSISRLIILIIYIWYIKKLMPMNLNTLRWKISLLPKILKFGGWLTVSNVVGPIMSYLDRFLIGIWISMAAVTYYVTPHELVTKILIFPSALMSVLLPAFSYAYFSNKDKSIEMVKKTTKLVVAIIFPISIFFTIFSHEILDLWLGQEFAL